MKRYTKPIHVPEVVRHRRVDASLALINVVFLLLLFLLVAGTLKPPLPEGFAWAETSSDTGSSNIQGSLVLTRTGDIWFEGRRLDEQELSAFLHKSAALSDRLAVQVDRHARMEAVAAFADRLRAGRFRHLTLVTIEADRR